jgi:MHS family proline/betaine transporter-like MFS transporter
MDRQVPRARQIVAAVIGNALEWYDFTVYGFLAVVISRLFFPSASEYSSLLLTLATFGAGFFMRPVGAILLGLYADRKGRKAALQLVILLMTLAVALMAFAPTYAAIGVGAPLLMVVARLLQGFATGGEFSSATSFLVECAPRGRRGLYGSLQMVGQSLSALGGALAGTLVTRGLSPDQIDAWGWRVPFLVGLLIGPVGIYIRRHLEETDEFKSCAQAPARHAELRTLAFEHARSMAAAFGLIVCGTTAFYIVLVYMPIYAKTQLALPLGDAFLAQVIALAWLTAVIPLCGRLTDSVGRRPVLIAATIAYFVLPYPLLQWVHAAPSLERLLIMQMCLCTAVGAFYGCISTVLAEQFPTALRSTGMGIAYNFAVMLFGGFAPFIVTWLIKETDTPLAPAFYVMFGAAVGFAASFAIVEGRTDARLVFASAAETA